jgi:hypothetical protein
VAQSDTYVRRLSYHKQQVLIALGAFDPTGTSGLDVEDVDTLEFDGVGSVVTVVLKGVTFPGSGGLRVSDIATQSLTYTYGDMLNALGAYDTVGTVGLTIGDVDFLSFDNDLLVLHLNAVNTP